jgi:tRNA(Ile)-lysidine synthase
MASSRKSNLTDRVAELLAPHLPRHSRILTGLSGGIDSVVLLHLLHSLAPRFEWRLSALHVHHGISPNADVWADFCSELCARHGIPLHIERVDIAPLRDEHGLEAAARKLRHAAFVRQDCDLVALAHHADDQVETLLLQLLRGAGIKGGAGMPFVKPGKPSLLRPLLDTPRSELEAYARQYQLSWVEDESNADDSYPRNFLRHRLLPLLEQRFPAYRETLSRSAAHFAEAAELLDELAQLDGVSAMDGNTLRLEALRGLSRQRAKNLLRYFLHTQCIPMPQAARLDDLLSQLLEARADAAVCAEFGGWEVRRYQGKAYAMPGLGGFDQALVLQWRGEADLAWPALNSRLLFTRTVGQGISMAKLQSAPVTLRLRNGGESLRPHPSAATRSLKNLLQEQQVPPWRRERLPLLYCGDELVSVVGVAVAAAYQAGSGESGLTAGLEGP